MKKLDLGFAMRVATEHLSYRSLIAEIEEDMERVRKHSGSVEELVRLLRSFQAQVRGHFALEERGGLFEVYSERDRAFRERAAYLLAQHGEFLERLARVLELAAGLRGEDGPEHERCETELRSLFAALREHEQAEDVLLDELVEKDIRQAD